MKELKIETKTVHIVEYHEWDNFIKKNFPKCKYEGITCEEEMSNDSTYSHKTTEISLEKKEEARKFLNGSKDSDFISTAEILNYLSTDNFIPKGVYNINICW
ncbi:MAG: hypothetical protein ACFFG0_00575 [Candidatus Thorarchaeota archaeon]